MTKIEKLKEYIEFLKTTDIEELKIESSEGEKIHIKRSEILSVPVEPVQVVSKKEKSTPSVPEKKEVKETKDTKSKEFVVKSPMVGRFLSSIPDDHPPFVVEGTKVSQGQKLCVIESMRIFKDVLSPVAGTVKKNLVQSGEYVEYGKELFIIELSEEQKS